MDFVPVESLEREAMSLDPLRPSELRSFLAAWNFHPSRVLGQNFLVDRNIRDSILDAAGAGEGSAVVEPGPGLGVLTTPMLERGCRVAALEKDPRLAAFLRLRHAGNPNLRLIEGDALDAPLAKLFAEPGAMMVSNLPYAISSRILMEAAGLPVKPRRMVVTVQREVADRMAAAPGTPDYGLLSIALQRHYDVRVLRTLSPTCFWPPPEVRSAVVRLELRAAPLGGECDEAELRELLKLVFSQRRKTLARSLRTRWPRAAEALEAAGIPSETRPETLPVTAFPGLLRALG